jgi:hypothetical protein
MTFEGNIDMQIVRCSSLLTSSDELQRAMVESPLDSRKKIKKRPEKLMEIFASSTTFHRDIQ